MSKHIEDMAEGLPDSPIWAYPKYITQINHLNIPPQMMHIGIDLASSEDKGISVMVCSSDMGVMEITENQAEQSLTFGLLCEKYYGKISINRQQNDLDKRKPKI
jgi:hypothetical protein